MPEVNGFPYDFACLKTKFDGVEYPIEEFNVGIKRENAKGYGNYRTVQRRTLGRANGDGCRFSMVKDPGISQAFKDGLVKNYGGILNAVFPASVTYGDQDQTKITEDVPDIMIMGIGADAKEGTDILLEVFDFEYVPKTSTGAKLFK